MLFIENYGDLFEVDKSYAKVHCIAHDCAMGAGIAKQFVRNYKWLKPDVKSQLNGLNYEPKSVLSTNGKDVIFNLVTKQFSYGKPTYASLRMSLTQLSEQCHELGIEKLVMPKIGCGLDRLNWNIVTEMIKDIFKNSDVEILVKIM